MIYIQPRLSCSSSWKLLVCSAGNRTLSFYILHSNVRRYGKFNIGIWYDSNITVYILHSNNNKLSPYCCLVLWVGMLTVTTTTAHSGSSHNALHSLVICVYLALVKAVLQYGGCLGEGHGPPWANGEDWTVQVWWDLGRLHAWLDWPKII